ncbi:MAG: hypothetical protein C0394_12800 [Syntrophus sp. (in: bacteria)]|nr:hypothetical protein [Syntrophus sp. (in: bacteria)]
MAVGLITAGTAGGPFGDVVLSAAGGSIIPSGTGGIVGSTVNLAVTSPGSTVGSGAAGALNITADKVDVTTDGGSMFLNDVSRVGVQHHYDTTNMPDIIAQDNHFRGGWNIDKIFQAQTTLNSQYQFTYGSIIDGQITPLFLLNNEGGCSLLRTG